MILVIVAAQRSVIPVSVVSIAVGQLIGRRIHRHVNVGTAPLRERLIRQVPKPIVSGARVRRRDPSCASFPDGRRRRRPVAHAEAAAPSSPIVTIGDVLRNAVAVALCRHPVQTVVGVAGLHAACARRRRLRRKIAIGVVSVADAHGTAIAGNRAAVSGFVALINSLSELYVKLRVCETA